MIGMTYLAITILGVLLEELVLAYANSLREPTDDQ